MRGRVALCVLGGVVGCSLIDLPEPGEPPAGGAGGTVECSDAEPCPDPGGECRAAICVEGSCETEPLDAGTMCSLGVCDGDEACVPCLTTPDCLTSAHCIDQSCIDDLEDGSRCVDSDECVSGVCTDGVCCDATCSELCRSCNFTGFEGQCTAHDPGTDPDSECTGAAVCDGQDGCAGGEPKWLGQAGDDQDQFLIATVVDPNGDVVITGNFKGSINLGCPETHTSAGDLDVYVAKLDPSGGCVWSHSFSGAAEDRAFDVAADASGNIWVGGFTWGDLTVEGTTLTNAGFTDAYLVKLSSAGARLDSWMFGDAGFDILASVDVDPAGNVCIAGHYTGDIDLDPAVDETAVGGFDIFVAKLTPAGALSWSKVSGDALDQFANAVACADGSVAVGGYFSGSFLSYPPSIPAISATNEDGFLAQYSPSGTAQWTRRLGDAGNERVTRVALTDSGVVVAIGEFVGTLDLDTQLVNPGPAEAAFVASFSGGTPLRSRAIGGGTTTTSAAALALHPDGWVHLGGGFGGGTLTLGQQFNASPYGSGYVAKLAPTGEILFSAATTESGGHGITAIAVAANGDSYVGGLFYGTMGFADEVVISAGGSDAFLAKLGP